MASVYSAAVLVLCLQVVAGQFGFFQNRREDRRYDTQYGFQNVLPSSGKIRTTLSGILHLRPDSNRNPAYTYPFNRPGITNDDYYDQYGRPQYNYGNGNGNFGHEHHNYNDGFNDRKPVRFPNPYEPPPFIPNPQYRPIVVPDYPEQNGDIYDNPNPERPDTPKPVVFPDNNYNNNNGNNYVEPTSATPALTEKTTLPALTPVPTEGTKTEFPPFKPVPESELPAFHPPTTSEAKTELPSLQPVATEKPGLTLDEIFAMENNAQFPAYNPDSGTQGFPSKPPVTEFPPFKPVPESELPAFHPPTTSEAKTELPPLQPVATDKPGLPLDEIFAIENNAQFPAYNPDSGTQGFQSKPPEIPASGNLPALRPVNATYNPVTFPTAVPARPSESDLPALTPAPTSKEPSPFQPAPPPTPSEPEELLPLTPVSPSESRNNFNPFQETCTTVDGGTGSCVTVFDCEPYIKLLQQSRADPTLVQILRKAHCGFDGNDPKVCCPRQGFASEAPTAAPTTPSPPPPTPPPEPQGREDLTDMVFPEPPVCGFSNASLGRVVGGQDASLGDFPWMALLGYQGRRPGQATRWLCGGSLITSQHVLTAAHCIHGHESTLYVVRLGELDLSREDDGATPVDILIKNKVKHEQYNANAYTNDIAVLVLERQVEFTGLISPICIPRAAELRAQTFERYTPITAGWGDLAFRGAPATHLQAVQLPVVTNGECATAYSAYKAQVIDERVLCAGYKQGKKDTCQGDSGGPLMQPIYSTEDYKTYFYQIGVVSFGRKCAEAGFPGVYSRVTHFVPWLEKTVQENV